MSNELHVSPRASPVCLQVFEASEFAPHPMYSVTQGGLDLQQVTIINVKSVNHLHSSAYKTQLTFFKRWAETPLWSTGMALRAIGDLSDGEEGLCGMSKFTQSIIWHEALKTTAERKAAAIVLPCHKGYNPS